MVDLGVIAGTAPKTNACFWLSFIAAASHVLGPDHQAPDMAIWTALREDLAAVRETEASHLQHAARNGPRVDAVGTAADYLRRYACDRMATADGCERWQPWFANLAGDVNAPEGCSFSLVFIVGVPFFEMFEKTHCPKQLSITQHSCNNKVFFVTCVRWWRLPRSIHGARSWATNAHLCRPAECCPSVRNVWHSHQNYSEGRDVGYHNY